ncbi:dTDP-glucose 4,6-dehydratase [Bacillus salacetis]|uniref:dTDP-glucose 4,6-dehydratase n=1 Tax=Bacillus salacetis TaxID=2315464 RepID=A0A3A1QR19_9BACI|nr:dTDP-glucose 4,6-dehydratase [Bacillus salacetis]RIW29347.1 dTDP-glucose 4,6-dehydratase [Bacillus salacetis]
MNLLITGGAGFIGMNFVRMVLACSHHQVTVADSLTYASHPQEIKTLSTNPRFRFLKRDISNEMDIAHIFDREYDAVINFAAESHVDNSIHNADLFLQTNITGTHNLLKYAKKGFANKMIQISTDEVYGTLAPDDQPFTENSPLQPNNPYSATKASADLLVRSFFETYGLPLIITRCSNNFGPFQHAEKFIPTVIRNALQDKEIPVYGDGRQIRDWLYVEDHCMAILQILEKGRPGEVYNIGGENEHQNIEIARTILQLLKKPDSLITYVKDRPGHDRRYAIDSSKLQRETGWKPSGRFIDRLEYTVNWFGKHHKGDRP